MGLYFLTISERGAIWIPSRVFFLTNSIVDVLLYLYFYRRDNLCCFELIFFLLYIVSVFFQEVVINNLVDDLNVTSVLGYSFNSKYSNLSLLVQSSGLLTFILGAIFGDKIIVYQKKGELWRKPVNLTASVNVIGVMTGLYILFLYLTGTIQSWFQYSEGDDNYSNLDIVYLTSLFLPMTILEFYRLSDVKCNNIRHLLQKINKIYLIEILLISLLLLVSGNRNESLLIIAPAVYSYSIFINKITNAKFFTLLFLGAFVMILIGLTRQEGTSSDTIASSEIGLYESSRDFVYVDINTTYLIQYTNEKGPIYFKNGCLNIISMVPFLGTVVKSVFDIDYDIRSPEVTTLGLQNPMDMNSGLGTSLIGDLYYTAGPLFVLLFMFFLGWLTSYLYKYFFIYKGKNVWLLAVFLFNFSNSVYYIRAEWMMPFRYVGFACIIMYLCFTFIPAKKDITKLKPVY